MRLGFFTLQEDRAAVILADRLGFHDAFVGEHLTDPEENVTNSFIFLATLIAETKSIRLASGTSNLSHSHPALVAVHAGKRGQINISGCRAKPICPAMLI